MRVVVTGSRKWNDRTAIKEALLDCGATLVAHGDASGADRIAHAVAASEGIDIVTFPANWNGRNKAAGPYRNRLMIDTVKPELVLAFPMPDSVGTWDAAKYAEKKGIPVVVCDKYI